MNRGSGCCRPLPYHLAIAPLFAFVNTQLLFTKTKISAPASARAGTAYSEYRKNIPVNCWSGLRGSNSLPPPWQGGALPDELNPRSSVYSAQCKVLSNFIYTVYSTLYTVLVLPIGIEPTTRGFSVPCSTN